MNIAHLVEAERLLIEQPDDKFDMRVYYQRSTGVQLQGFCTLRAAQEEWNAQPCNTVCCLAGLLQMHKAHEIDRSRDWRAFDFAMFWLDVNNATARWLFMPEEYSDEKRVLKSEVLERLRWLIAYAQAANENLARELGE